MTIHPTLRRPGRGPIRVATLVAGLLVGLSPLGVRAQASAGTGGEALEAHPSGPSPHDVIQASVVASSGRVLAVVRLARLRVEEPVLAELWSYDPSAGAWTRVLQLAHVYDAVRAVALGPEDLLLVGTAATEAFSPASGGWWAPAFGDDEAELSLVAERVDTGAATTRSVALPAASCRASGARAVRLVRLDDQTAMVVLGSCVGLFEGESESFRLVAPPRASLVGASLTALPEGEALLAGGSDLDGEGAEALGQTWIYRGGEGWSRTADLNEPRVYHDALGLDDGRVLVAGGCATRSACVHPDGFVPSVEVYDPEVGSWERLAMPAPVRSFGGLAQLSDQSVLVLGGSVGDAPPWPRGSLLDLDSRTWWRAPPLREPRAAPQVYSGRDGELLVAGGFCAEGCQRQVEHYRTSVLVDSSAPPLEALAGAREPPVCDSPSDGADDHDAWSERLPTALLEQGRSLRAGPETWGGRPYDLRAELDRPFASLSVARIQGGSSLWLAVGVSSPDGALGAELLDPGADSWRDVSPSRTTCDTSAGPVQLVPLAPERVLVLGTGCQLAFSGATEAWWRLAPSPRTLAEFTATRLEDGRVLVAGGEVVTHPRTGRADAGVLLYDPATKRWSETAPLNAPRRGHGATLMADGRVLVAGGYDHGPTPAAGIEIFEPSSESWEALPMPGAPRPGASVTRLAGGQVLILGGGSDELGWQDDGLVFDPDTQGWRYAPVLPQPRTDHDAIALDAFGVVVTGGACGPCNAECEPRAFVYDPIGWCREVASE